MQRSERNTQTASRVVSNQAVEARMNRSLGSAKRDSALMEPIAYVVVIVCCCRDGVSGAKKVFSTHW